MAKGVMNALDEVLAPLNFTGLTLKAQGSYREDAYCPPLVCGFPRPLSCWLL
jgi:hypothetical protein